MTPGRHSWADWSGSAVRLGPAAVSIALTAFALALTRSYAVDWFYNDDLLTLRWFAEADAGRLRPSGLLALWNNEHPVGAQFALLWLARRAVGLHMRAFVALSVCVVAATAAVAAGLAADGRDSLAARCAAVAACFALAFQPTQAEHLLWSFEIGWFVVNAVVVCDAAMAERFGPRAALPAAALCTVASLASAQGALTFFAAALHQILLPPRPGRRRAGTLLAFGGMVAVAHLSWLPQASASGPAHPDRDYVGIAVFAVEILGGLFGLRDRVPLLAGGLSLLAVAALLFWLRRRSLRPDRLRCAAILMGFSALCLGAFAQGRHHLGLAWATSSFHAAPLLVPFALGCAVLLGAPRIGGSVIGGRLDGAATVAAALLLGASTAVASSHAVTWARLWAMDRGYARWATCSGQVPAVVAARGSGVDHDLAGFEAIRPLAMQLCGPATASFEAALIRRPSYFDALAVARPEVGPALDALWQDYATSLNLQLAFKPWRDDTPMRLLVFARQDAEKGSEVDPGRLAPHADSYRSLAP